MELEEEESKKFELEQFEGAKVEQDTIYNTLVQSNLELREKILIRAAENEEFRKSNEHDKQAIIVFEKKKEALGLEELKSQLAELTKYEEALTTKEAAIQEEMKQVAADVTKKLLENGAAMDQLQCEFKSPESLKNGARMLAFKITETEKSIEIKKGQIEEIQKSVEVLRNVKLIDLSLMDIIRDDAKAELDKVNIEIRKVDTNIARAKSMAENQAPSRFTSSSSQFNRTRGGPFGRGGGQASRFWSQRQGNSK